MSKDTGSKVTRSRLFADLVFFYKALNSLLGCTAAQLGLSIVTLCTGGNGIPYKAGEA
jgi:hypothetical protein